MQLSWVTLALAALVLAVDATVILTTTAGTVTTAAAVGAAALAGVGGLALGAGLVGALAGGGRRGGRRGRGRRAADADDELRRDLALDVSAAADTAGCALKLVCLLEAQPQQERAEEAGALLELVGEPELPAEVETPRQAYLYSAYLGSVGGAPACQRQFPVCPYGLKDMMAYVRRLSA